MPQQKNNFSKVLHSIRSMPRKLPLYDTTWNKNNFKTCLLSVTNLAWLVWKPKFLELMLFWQVSLNRNQAFLQTQGKPQTSLRHFQAWGTDWALSSAEYKTTKITSLYCLVKQKDLQTYLPFLYRSCTTVNSPWNK